MSTETSQEQLLLAVKLQIDQAQSQIRTLQGNLGGLGTSGAEMASEIQAALKAVQDAAKAVAEGVKGVGQETKRGSDEQKRLAQELQRELALAGKEGYARQRAEAKLHYDEMRRMAKGNADLLLQIERAEVERELEIQRDASRQRKQFATAAAAGVGVAIAGTVSVTSMAWGNFEAILNGIQAVADTTDKELEDIRVRAIDLGAKTKFSAKEAAEGFFELAKAGFNAKQQLEAIDGVMALAAAGGIGVGQAAEATAGILRGFNLEMSKAGMVADMLAKAANQSAIDISDIQQSMKYIAPVASGANQSLEEMTGILAVLGNNLIKSEQAGTSLRAMFATLQNPSKDAATDLHKLGISIQDTHGKMLPLSDIIGQLKTKTEGMTQVQKNATIANIFGSEALSAVLVLLNQQPGALDKAIQSQHEYNGAAQQMSDTMNRGVNASLEQMRGSADTLATTIGRDLSPAVQGVATYLTNLLNVAGDVPAPLRLVGEAIMGIVFAATAIVTGAAGAKFAIRAIAGEAAAAELKIKAAAFATKLFAGNLNALSFVGFGIIAAGFGLIAKAVNDYSDALRDASERQSELVEKQSKLMAEGSAAVGKFRKGLTLTPEEARAGALYFHELANAATDAATKAKDLANAGIFEAMFNSLKAAKNAPVQRGAIVADPNKTKTPKDHSLDELKGAALVMSQYRNGLIPAQTALNQLKAEATDLASRHLTKTKEYAAVMAGIYTIQKAVAAEQKKHTKEEAEAQAKKVKAVQDEAAIDLDRAKKYGTGYAGIIKALEKERDALVAIGASKKLIADVEAKIAKAKDDQTKAEAKLGKRDAKAEAEAVKAYSDAINDLTNIGKKAAEALGVDLNTGIGAVASKSIDLVDGGLGAAKAIKSLQDNAKLAIPALLEMGQAAWASLGPLGVVAGVLVAAGAGLKALGDHSRQVREDAAKEKADALSAALAQFEKESQYGKHAAQDQVAYYKQIATAAEASAETRERAATLAYDVEKRTAEERNSAIDNLIELTNQLAQAEYSYQKQKLEGLKAIADLEQQLADLEADTAKQIADVEAEGVLARRKSDDEVRADRIAQIREKAEQQRKELLQRLDDAKRQQAALEETHKIEMEGYQAKATALGKIIDLNQTIIDQMLLQASLAGAGANTSAGAGKAGGAVVDIPKSTLPTGPQIADAGTVQWAKSKSEWANRRQWWGAVPLPITGPGDRANTWDEINQKGKDLMAAGDTATAAALRSILQGWEFSGGRQIAFASGGLIPDQARFNGMRATLHQGEMILPRTVTQALLQAVQGGGRGGSPTLIFQISGNYLHPQFDVNGLGDQLSYRIASNLRAGGLI